MDAVSTNKSLTIESYFKEYAFQPLSDKLTTTEKVITLAITVFATIFTAGLFALGVAAYQFCIIPTLIQATNETGSVSLQIRPVTGGKPTSITIERPFTSDDLKLAIARATGIDASRAKEIDLFVSGTLLVDKDGKSFDTLTTEDVITYNLPKVAEATDANKYKFRIQGEEIALEITNPTLADMQAAIAKAKGIKAADAGKIKLIIAGKVYTAAEAAKANDKLATLDKETRIMVMLPLPPIDESVTTSVEDTAVGVVEGTESDEDAETSKMIHTFKFMNGEEAEEMKIDLSKIKDLTNLKKMIAATVSVDDAKTLHLYLAIPIRKTKELSELCDVVAFNGTEFTAETMDGRKHCLPSEYQLQVEVRR